MTRQSPSVLILGFVAVPIGIVLLFLIRKLTGHWWVRLGSPSVMRPGGRRLLAEALGRANRHANIPSYAAATLFRRLDAIEQNLKRGQNGLAAEAVQWFQWEVLRARLQGTISRGVAIRLIEDAQILCEHLWACERKPASKEPFVSD